MIHCTACRCAISDGHVYTFQALTYHLGCFPLKALEAILKRFKTTQQDQTGKVET